jgi:hypothetical protein
MIWNSPTDWKYPGVTKFAEQIKLTLLSAHDSIIEARVKQTRNANCHGQPSSFGKGSLVYLSTQNIKLAKGLARKFSPKYSGPYKILEDYHNDSYKIDLPPELKQRGVHPTFHASLLWRHIPNDNRLFPGQLASQLGFADQLEPEWSVKGIIRHQYSGKDAMFLLEWGTGDCTWLPYHDVQVLDALQDYFEVLGIKSIDQLRGPCHEDLEIPLSVNLIEPALKTLAVEWAWNDEFRTSFGQKGKGQTILKGPGEAVSSLQQTTT